MHNLRKFCFQACFPHRSTSPYPLTAPTLRPFAAASPDHRVANPPLAHRSESIFLSDDWYQACIESWTRRARFRTLLLEGGPHGPVRALLGARTELRHGVLPVRVLALNQAGIPELDQPWIERNGFFGGREQDFEAHLTLLLGMIDAESDWDELRLGGLSSEHARQALCLAPRHGLSGRVELEQPSFSIDLAAIRTTHGGEYLSVLSANTRQQLRRSRRLAEQAFGALTLREAGSIDEAHAWLDATGPLHRARWGAPDGATHDSGFDNPAFVAFHRRLIELSFPRQTVQYLRLQAGDTPFAYLYNFVCAGNAHFYLSGIDYRVGERYRPGLLAHWLAIERNLGAGHHAYDFLAGDARYKRSLCTGQHRTVWLVLQRPRRRLQLEGVARRIKRRLSARS